MRLHNPFRWLAAKAAGTLTTQVQMIGPGWSELTAGIDPKDPLSYATNAWVYSCVSRIGTAVANAPMIVERRRGQEWVPAPDHRLAALLDYVNQDEDEVQLTEGLACWLALYGNAYAQLGRTGDTTPPVAMQVLLAHQMEPQKDGTWKYSGGEQQQTLKKADVLHCKRYNPYSRITGQSPIRVIENEVTTYWHATRYHRAHFKGGGTPSLILSTEAALTQAQVDQYKASYREWAAQGDVRRLPLWLGGGLKVSVPGAPPDAASVKDLPAELRVAICAVLEVPPPLVGILDRATYDNIRTVERLFYRDTVTNYWRRIGAALNEQLCPQFGPDVRVRFDTSKIAALQPDYAEASQIIPNLLKVFTPNEVRERMFGETTEPSAWGDSHWGGISDVTLAGPGGEIVDSFAPSQPAQEPAPQKSVSIRKSSGDGWRRLPDASRKALAKGFDRRRRQEERSLARALRPWWSDLETEVISNLQASKSLSRPIIAKVPSLDALLFDVDEAGNALGGRIEPRLADLFQRTGEQAIATVDAAISFDVDSPRAREILRGRTLQMKTVAQTAQDRCRTALTEGLAQGETIEQLTDRVREWANAGRESHCENVARTETGIAMNSAALEGYRQGGADGKEWLSVVDDRSRPEHAAMDGTVVGIDEPFDLDGTPCDGPGDPALGPEDDCNCRCTLAPVVAA